MFLVKKVRFKNFRSYGNLFTEVDLMRSRTTAITAKNGAGKTSILHAITFALFGKVTGINKNTLINDINNKDCVVEVECSKNGQEILVRRGIKPVIFDIVIDGVLVDQSASSRDYQGWLEDVVLGFNLSSFQQVVSIHGGSYTPFFLLPAGARRKMVDELLSIGVFSKMQTLQVGAVNSYKDRMNDVERDIDKFEESIKSLKRGLDELSSRDADMIQIIHDTIAQHKEKIASKDDLIVSLNAKKDEIVFDAIELSKHSKKLTKMTGILRDLTTAKKNGDKFVNFLTENSVCPTCSNDLTDEFKSEHICKRESKNLEITEKISELENLIEGTKGEIDSLEAKKQQIIEIQTKIELVERERKFIVNLLKTEEAKLENTNTTSIDNLKNEIVKKNAILEDRQSEKMDLLVEKQYLDLQGLILKDSGIKSRVVNQMIPKMVNSINHYVTLMELGMNIEIDENFNETIYRRFSSPVSYAGVSAGEKARVDIAMLFAWREIAKAKNSLNCNLLFLDEVFDSALDDVGIDLFLNIIKNHLPDTNVFLISHRPEVIDKFESNIRIEKRSNFSVLC